MAGLARGFVECLSAVTFAGVPDAWTPVVDPEAVDEVIASSAALRELRLVAPWLETGPTNTESDQVWMATARPSWLPATHPRPQRHHFKSPAMLDDQELLRRPINGGLYTSSASRGYVGMWSSFVALISRDVLFPKPWTAWRLSMSHPPAVAQITGAQDWAALVEEHGVVVGDFRCPDWRSLTSEYDAVHFTPAAVCAIDGLALRSSAGIIRPMCWSVESTLWLHWCFDSVELIADFAADE